MFLTVERNIKIKILINFYIHLNLTANNTLFNSTSYMKIKVAIRYFTFNCLSIVNKAYSTFSATLLFTQPILLNLLI